MPNPTIRSLIGMVPTTKVIGHLMPWWYKGSQHNKSLRAPGYDQLDPLFVKSHCDYFKSLGLNVIMIDTFGADSTENIVAGLYAAALIPVGLTFCICIDAHVYRSLPREQRQQALLDYGVYLRKTFLGMSNYEKYQGKFLLPCFPDDKDDPAWFTALQAANPDCIVFTHDPNKTKHTMGWVKSDVEANVAWTIRTFGPGLPETLFIPHVPVGFNDTDPATKMCCWGGPPNVWPAGIGPNMTTWLNCWSLFRAGNAIYKFPYVQFILNDWEEGTATERTDKSLGYVDPIPKTLQRGEIWIDGTKLGDLPVSVMAALAKFPSGKHILTVVKAYTDETVDKTDFPFTT